MKKWFLAAAFAATIALLSQWMYWLPAQAQAPAGLNPANYISGSNTTADTSSFGVSIGDATHFTYVCGFAVSGLGATSTTSVIVAVGPFAGTTGATLNLGYGYVFAAGATAPSNPLLQNFTPCIPVFGAATVTVPGAAGNTSTSASIWGYKQ